MIAPISLFCNEVLLDCNTLSPLRLQWSYTLRKSETSWVSPTQKFFKVSEEKIVTGSQVRTIAWMVKIYKAIFPYNSPRCAWLVCGCIVMMQQDTSRQLSTAYLTFSRKATIMEAWVSSVMVVSCGMNSKSRTPSKSQKTVVMIFLADCCTQHFLEVGDRFCFHCMDFCLVSGLWWLTHVSSPIIILEKFSRFALSMSKFSSLNCWRHAQESTFVSPIGNWSLTSSRLNGWYWKLCQLKCPVHEL